MFVLRQSDGWNNPYSRRRNKGGAGGATRQGGGTTNDDDGRRTTTTDDGRRTTEGAQIIVDTGTGNDGEQTHVKALIRDIMCY